MNPLNEVPGKCECGRAWERDDLEFVGVRKKAATADLFCPGCTRVTRVTRAAWIKARDAARGTQRQEGDGQ